MNLADDSKYALLLKNSVKNKAENLMVVDLIRNDLGRICLPGSVRAQRMFNIEKYSTLFQMTSQVTGKLRAESSYFDIFKTLFPGGSVTGAPKIRTMEIIENLEKRPRGIYCGALGFIAPGGKAVFNMPIRTLRLAGGKGSMGVGSGIVIDSRGSEEYAECLLKASFLTARPRDFRLIETIAWDKGYFLLSRHIDRLSSSARYFGFILPAGIKKELELYAKKFKSGRKYRVRLLLQKDGKINLEHKVIEAKCGLNRYAVLSKHQTDPTDIFLYHKTTNRDLYDQEYKKFNSKRLPKGQSLMLSY
jgi:para-aminobenzoate synthetase/4-amino-4-deoxychorismate lyase